MCYDTSIYFKCILHPLRHMINNKFSLQQTYASKKRHLTDTYLIVSIPDFKPYTFKTVMFL